MKRVIVGLGVVLAFSGCSMMKDKAETFIAERGLDKKVSMICYDYFDKKECPSDTKQVDIDVLPFVPDSSRFCLGFVDKNATKVEGMKCVSRDIIKRKED